MDCKEFRDSIASLLEPDNDTARMKEHMEQCSECAEYYENTVYLMEAVTPRGVPETPAEIKRNVLEKASAAKKTSRLQFAARKVSGIAAGVAIVVVAASLIVLSVGDTSNTAKAANNARLASDLFATATSGMGDLNSMVMKLDIRTLANENFSYITLSGSMVPHTIEAIYSRPSAWKVEKPGRSAVFDGNKQYMWQNFAPNGYVGGKNSGFIEDFAMLLDPRQILEKEKAEAGRRGNKYDVTENATETFLTVNAKAQGNFRNDYMLNSSIPESNNRREYIFDKATGRLKSLKVSVEGKKGKDVLVVETQSIEYNTYIDRNSLVALPEGYNWYYTETVVVNELFASITAAEATRLIFKAMSEGTTEDIKEILVGYNRESLYKTYGGCRNIKIGTPFRSGSYAGWFVPYEITLRNGKKQKHNLALRNDNPNCVWVVDGGL